MEKKIDDTFYNTHVTYLDLKPCGGEISCTGGRLDFTPAKSRTFKISILSTQNAQLHGLVLMNPSTFIQWKVLLPLKAMMRSVS